MNEYHLQRALFLRSLASIFLVSFLSLAVQEKVLFSSAGLLPVSLFLEEARSYDLDFSSLPTLFWFSSGDRVLNLSAWLGVALSIATIWRPSGFGFLLLWALGLSWIGVGQIFLGYGWETLLLEAGFFAAFYAPFSPLTPLSRAPAPSPLLPWLLRWLLVRVMFGAGAIKLRGDACWRDFSCLEYHFETQPIPNPASWYFHHLPAPILKLGVFLNHITELFLPWFAFGPRRGRVIAGLSTIIFQSILIISGNLSWLNYLTVVVAIGCFDDAQLRSAVAFFGVHLRESHQAPPLRRWMIIRDRIFFAVIAVLSIQPALNLVSDEQVMNGSFDPLHLVNTYGAFGSIGKVRDELIIEGTRSNDPADEHAEWREYELPCKPGNVLRRPCIISPFQPRLDWQIWFAAMQRIQGNPWLIHLVKKLLEGDRGVITLLGNDPFPDEAPRWIRIQRYRYRFTDWGEPGWWTREYRGNYLPAVSLQAFGR